MLHLLRRAPLENPLPEAAIECHEELWEAVRHLRIRTKLTDERVLFVMQWMMPATWGLLLVILGCLLTQ